MGTSTDYSAPPSWGDFKGDVTRTARKGSLTSDQISGLVKSFIDHNGGASGIARRGGGASKVARGTSAKATAQRLGGFLADVSRVGLQQALANAGWSDLHGRPVGEILTCLLDRLGGEASTIDQVDARMALSKLQEKYLADAETEEHLNRLFTEQSDHLDVVLADYFGFYLFEVFCRVFFERLVARLGEMQAQSFLDQIRDFIVATLANRTSERSVSQVDWSGQEGQNLTTEIMETTLRVFGG